MLDRLIELEQAMRPLEADETVRADWRRQVVALSETFLEGLPDRAAFRTDDGSGDPLAELDVSEAPTPMAALVETFERQVLDVHLNPASGRFFGYIPGGGLYASALGDFLAAVSNRYSGVHFASPGAARIENLLVRWIARTMGFPVTAGGTLTSGGSLANLAAVVTAREEVPFDERSRAVAYMTSQVHHSMLKALRVAGMGDAVHRQVPIDDRFHMMPDELQRLVEADRKASLIPWLLITSAGTVNTGAVDPIDALSDVARRHGLWHHIDAAYGGFFVLCDPGRAVLRGMERGDSITVDPHKGLFLPYGCGCVVVGDHRKLQDSHRWQADYMQDAVTPPDESSPMDYSPEMTRHFRGLRLWLPLRLTGLAPFRAALEEKMLLARWFHEELTTLEGFECGPYPELSVATFRYRPRGVAANDVEALNDFNLRLAEAIQRDGRVFLSSTRLTGTGYGENAVYLRLAVLCFRSHHRHVGEVIDVLKRLTAALETGATVPATISNRHDST